MKQDISKKTEAVDFGGFDSIVIVKHGADIPGGRTLDVTGFPLNVIKASHVVITDGKGVYKPFPVKQKMNVETPVVDAEGNPVYEYGSLPESFSICGMVYRSVLKSAPAVSILTQGIVNDVVMKEQYIELGAIAAQFKTACPDITFTHDEEA